MNGQNVTESYTSKWLICYVNIKEKHHGGLERLLNRSEHFLLLQRTEVWFPAPKWQLTTVRNFSFGGSDVLIIWPLQALHACCALKYTKAKYLHKN